MSACTLFFMCSMQTLSILRILSIISTHTLVWSKLPPPLAWIATSLTCPCLHTHFHRTYHQYSGLCDLFNSKSHCVTHLSQSSSHVPLHIIKAKPPDHGLLNPLRAYLVLFLWNHFCYTPPQPTPATLSWEGQYFLAWVYYRLIMEQDSSPPTDCYSKVTLSLMLNTFLKIEN